MIDEILDILEVLRLSKLLCMDVIRAVAMHIVLGLRNPGPHVSLAQRLPTAPSQASLLLLLVLGQELLCTHVPILKASWQRHSLILLHDVLSVAGSVQHCKAARSHIELCAMHICQADVCTAERERVLQR